MPETGVSLWSRLKSGIKSLAPRFKQSDPQWSLAWWWNPYTDELVVPETSIAQPTVFACVRAIATTIAMLPWDVYERSPGGNRRNIDPADTPEGDTAWLLSVQSNPDSSAVTFRETLIAHALCWGNGFAEIERDALGRPLWLWPITPDRVRVWRDGGRLLYAVGGPGGEVYIPAEDMLHLRGLGFDGVVGYSVLTLAANTIALAWSSEKYAANFYGSGGLPAGVLKLPVGGVMTDERKKGFAKAWDDAYGGRNRGRKTAVLEAGVEYSTISLPNTDQQFLETRQFAVTDICRWFGVPPHMVYDLANAHYNNIEQQQIEFVQHSLLPWTIRLEQEANIKLFGRNQRGRRYTKINVMGLLRGDMKTRADYYRQMLTTGILSVNEIRALEEMNTIGTVGDERYIQVNMTTLERVAAGENNEPTEPTEGTTDETEPAEDRGEVEERDTGALSAIFMGILPDVFERLRRKEMNVLRPLLVKHAGNGEAILSDFREQWSKANPLSDSPLRAFATAYLEAGGITDGLETATDAVVSAAMLTYETDAYDRVKVAALNGLDSYGDGATASSRYSVRFVTLCEEHRSHENRQDAIKARVLAGERTGPSAIGGP